MVQSNPYFKQNLDGTKRRLKGHFNEQRKPFDNPSNISKPTTVSEHFLINDHSANDITFIPLELIKSNRAREAYLIERGKTLEHLDIYKMNIVHSLFLPFVFIHLYYFYISNFFHITTSTLFVFIHFQRSLFPYFNIQVLSFSSRRKAVPSEILVSKKIYSDCKINLPDLVKC